MKVKELIGNLMLSDNIIKTFHYCKQDSVALHYILGTCINNVFDTSATDNLISQLKIYKENNYIFEKNILAKLNNVKSPGLNEILKRYNAPHGINKYK